MQCLDYCKVKGQSKNVKKFQMKSMIIYLVYIIMKSGRVVIKRSGVQKPGVEKKEIKKK